MIITHQHGFEVVETLGNPTFNKALKNAKKDCTDWGGKFIAYSYDKKTTILTYINLFDYDDIMQFHHDFDKDKKYHIDVLPIDK